MNYYHNIWARCSHALAPLTKTTSSKVKSKWTKTEQDDFSEIKRIVDRDTLSDYPDFNGEFRIHTDASDFQFGAVIRQKVKPIAFNSIKLTDSYMRYKVS